MKNGKSIIYLIGLPNLGVGLLWAMNMTLIPELAKGYGANHAMVGRLVSMGAFTGIFVQYLAGLLSDRSRFKMGKRKPFMLLGALATALLMCIMPFSSNYQQLFLIAFLFYFCLNFYQGPYYSLIPEVVDESQLGVANGFARVISVLGGAFIFVAWPKFWQMKSNLNTHHSFAFFLAALLALSTVLVIVFLIKEKQTNISKQPRKLSFTLFQFPSVFRFYLVVFFIYLGYGCLVPFFISYCKSSLGFSTTTASFSLMLLTIVGALFAYPMGMLADKITRKRVMVLGTLIFGLALLSANFVRSITALYVVMSIVGIGFVTIQVTSYAILAELVPPEKLGEFMGMFNFFVSFSQFVAMNVMGILLDKVGFGLYFPISSSCVLMGVFILAVSKLKKYKELQTIQAQPEIVQ